MRIQVVLFVLLLTLNAADVATTLYGLELGATELNPLFNRQSVHAKIALSLVYVTVFTVAYWLCEKQNFSKGTRILNINLLALVGIYMVVVANNLIGIILNS